MEGDGKGLSIMGCVMRGSLAGLFGPKDRRLAFLSSLSFFSIIPPDIWGLTFHLEGSEHSKILKVGFIHSR